MWQPVFMISGYILGILGLIMFVPAGLDFAETDYVRSPFIPAAVITIFLGFSLFLANYTKVEKISLKQAYLITTVSWCIVGVFATLPFLFFNQNYTFADVFFETVSGITGTGATIFADVESLPRSILLWRSILNFLGGLGIVIFAVALLPFLGIGGMRIFQRENSDSNDKFMPKFSYIAKRIVVVYTMLVVICAITLDLCGMSWFDAVNHAMSSIGTGGFSTKNNSVAAFNSISIEIVIMLFMLAGSLPLTFYILLFRHGEANKNYQVSVFLKAVFYCGLFVSLYLFATSDYSLVQSLRYSFFNVISVMTTTGLSSTDFVEWGVWTSAVFMLLSLSGGCTGSTSGSIKIFRWQLIYAYLHKYVLSMVEPNRIIPLRVGIVNPPQNVITSVFVYVFSFIISMLLIGVAISLCGVDFSTSLAASVACMTNVGVGSVEVIGPSGNFAFFSESVKYLLCFAMLLGRLEVITVLVIFTRSFWRN